MTASRRPYNILVTGGAGFIGSHLVDALVEQGENVHVIDNLSTGQNKNLNPRSQFHEWDISRNGDAIKALFEKERFDYVFHLAAMARIQECVEKPITSFSINSLATLFLLEMTRECGGAFIFSSSSSVYGETEEGSQIGEGHRLAPISFYGLHKLASEQLTLMYHKFYGVKTVALRYFNVYGTRRQNPSGAYPNVIAAFDKADSEGKHLTIYGDGYQKRDFVHVFDVVKANTLWLDRDKGWGQAYNVGTGVPTSVMKVATFFKQERDLKPAREGDPRWSCADNEKLMLLGWRPTIRFDEGMDIFLKSI